MVRAGNFTVEFCKHLQGVQLKSVSFWYATESIFKDFFPKLSFRLDLMLVHLIILSNFLAETVFMSVKVQRAQVQKSYLVHLQWTVKTIIQNVPTALVLINIVSVSKSLKIIICTNMRSNLNDSLGKILQKLTL